VQALRYEDFDDFADLSDAQHKLQMALKRKMANTERRATLKDFIVDISVKNLKVFTAAHWYLYCEANAEENDKKVQIYY
jgi:hypothetical protein